MWTELIFLVIGTILIAIAVSYYAYNAYNKETWKIWKFNTWSVLIILLLFFIGLGFLIFSIIYNIIITSTSPNRAMSYPKRSNLDPDPMIYYTRPRSDSMIAYVADKNAPKPYDLYMSTRPRSDSMIAYVADKNAPKPYKRL